MFNWLNNVCSVSARPHSVSRGKRCPPPPFCYTPGTRRADPAGAVAWWALPAVFAAWPAGPAWHMQLPARMAKRAVKARAAPAATPTPCLTAAQFRALLKARGYSLAALARLWQLTPGRVSQLAASDQRPAHFDYALWGLPPSGQAHAVARRRRDALADLLQGKAAQQGARFDKAAYWREAIAIGAQFTSDYHFSEGIRQGSVGTVIACSGNSANPDVRIRFDTGYEEDFALSYLQAKDCHLWPRSLVATR